VSGQEVILKYFLYLKCGIKSN